MTNKVFLVQCIFWLWTSCTISVTSFVLTFEFEFLKSSEESLCSQKNDLNEKKSLWTPQGLRLLWSKHKNWKQGKTLILALLWGHPQIHLICFRSVIMICTTIYFFGWVQWRCEVSLWGQLRNLESNLRESCCWLRVTSGTSGVEIQTRKSALTLVAHATANYLHSNVSTWGRIFNLLLWKVMATIMTCTEIPFKWMKSRVCHLVIWTKCKLIGVLFLFFNHSLSIYVS